MYDVIIIGAGPAGLTAGIYTARKKLKTLILSKELSSQVKESWIVENYPGFEKISGQELVEKFFKHLKNYQVEVKLNEEVVKIKKEDKVFKVITQTGNIFEAKSIIIASGRIPRQLNIPDGIGFVGKGISYCAICDAPLYKDKVVAVVGSGNSGLEAVLLLAKYAKKVYLLDRDTKLEGDESLQEEIKKLPNVEIVFQTSVLEVLGEKRVNKLKVKKEGKETFLDVDGLFVEIGSIPSTYFAKDLLKFNNFGEIIIDRENQTSVEGIFAAGDVTDIKYKQIVIAAGEGAKAALSCYNYLQKLKLETNEKSF
jgi:thioredoxin-disulfide reductase